MRRILWILIIGIIAFWACLALVQPFREAVFGWFASVSPTVYNALMGLGAAIASNPIYQTYHPLLWLTGGIVLCVAAIKLWARRPVLIAKNKLTQPFQGAPQVQPIIIPSTVTPQTATVQPVQEVKKEEATAK